MIGAALRALAGGEALPGSRPPGPVPDSLVRIAQQIELLRGKGA